ncbi:putative N-acetyltransferase YjcK [Clavelina lepadiformis]|uniref:putative N-acetyltransferase YjcK n=1 Tax=Clavelina lepadiformis TaxID=159417 RepID=UPI0040419D32
MCVVPSESCIDGHVYQVKSGIMLRPLTIEDASESLEVVNKNRDRLAKWLPWVEGTNNVKDEVQYIREARNSIMHGKKLEMGIFYKSNSEKNEAKLIGACGFVKIQGKTGQLGYWLDEDYMGQGIVTDSCKTLIDVGVNFLGLKTIEIVVQPNNVQSIHVAKRLGFETNSELCTTDCYGKKTKAITFKIEK